MGKFSSLSERVGTVVQRVFELEENIEQQELWKVKLEDRIVKLEGNIVDIESTTSSNSCDIEKLKAQQSNLEQQFQVQESDPSELEHEMASSENLGLEHPKAMEDLSSRLEILEERVRIMETMFTAMYPKTPPFPDLDNPQLLPDHPPQTNTTSSP